MHLHAAVCNKVRMYVQGLCIHLHGPVHSDAQPMNMQPSNMTGCRFPTHNHMQVLQDYRSEEWPFSIRHRGQPHSNNIVVGPHRPRASSRASERTVCSTAGLEVHSKSSQ